MKSCASLKSFLVVFFSLSIHGPVLASEFGSAEEAKQMLVRAVKAIKSDRDVALTKFNEGADGFKDRDLYVFCFGPIPGVGAMVAHGVNQNLIGLGVDAFVDKVGKDFGQQMLDTVEADKISVMDYMWPRPNEEGPSQKASFYTLVDDLLCGVGYYK